MLFSARQFKFVFPRPALVMGIVNVTPDSFSDGGKFLDTKVAVNHALKLAAQGAEILDIGGESTRPGAAPVSETEELRRVVPVIKELAAAFETGKAVPPAISIDTMKPAVARAALEAGASIVNDVAAGRSGPEMWNVIREFHAGYVVMHASPGLHEKVAASEEVVDTVNGFFSERLNALMAFGVTPEQIVFDPGIGFGKNLEQNLRVIALLGSFLRLRRPLLLGVSRKSFIEKLFGSGVNERLPASLACAILGIESGAAIVRAHDVAETVQAVRMTEAVLRRRNG
ncbi:MAG TPA: dihydropteroate synthase [Candidatus Acidoferrales bacterium]|jgi:dihydropteroate synthase|nr:dihydropteroate synthase [Candidatus Acidoferrales bacterium]